MLSSPHSLSYFIILETLIVTNLVPIAQMRKVGLENLASKHQNQESNPALSSFILSTILNGLFFVKIFGKFSKSNFKSVRQTGLCFYHMLGIISKISYLLNYHYYYYINKLD